MVFQQLKPINQISSVLTTRCGMNRAQQKKNRIVVSGKSFNVESCKSALAVMSKRRHLSTSIASKSMHVDGQHIYVTSFRTNPRIYCFTRWRICIECRECFQCDNHFILQTHSELTKLSIIVFSAMEHSIAIQSIKNGHNPIQTRSLKSFLILVRS